MAWKKTKITNNTGKIVSAWKNEKGQISYTNPKAIGAAKKALQVSGVAKGLSGIRDTASFIRSSLKIDPGSRPGQFLGGPLPKKIEAKSKQLLIDEEKEKSLNPQNYKQWSETEEGKAFIQKEAAIQEGLDEDARYTFKPNLEEEIPPEKSSRITGATMKVTDLVPKDDDGGKAAWLKKTRNSAAAKAFGNSKEADDKRWALQQKHREWKEKRKNKKKLSIKD